MTNNSENFSSGSRWSQKYDHQKKLDHFFKWKGENEISWDDEKMCL